MAFRVPEDPRAASPCADAAPSPAADLAFLVAEKFVSVNGEGLAAGRLAAFVRFAGCNLDCAYCDTRWANGDAAKERAEAHSVASLVDWVRSTGVSAVTLTGGEPLLQPGLPSLMSALVQVADPRSLRVEVETNGSCDMEHVVRLREECDRGRHAAGAGTDVGDRILARGLAPCDVHFTVDWKTPAAGEAACAAMMRKNFEMLDGRDAVKFVVGSGADLEFAARCACEANLWERCQVLFSPVWGRIDPREIVEYMARERLARARLQRQRHKVLWPDVDKGV